MKYDKGRRQQRPIEKQKKISNKMKHRQDENKQEKKEQEEGGVRDRRMVDADANEKTDGEINRKSDNIYLYLCTDTHQGYWFI